MQFLNSKERKKFFGDLQETYGYSGSTDYVLYHQGKEKYYLLSRDVEKILETNIKIRHSGIYVATRMKDGQLRLSMDGAQFFGDECEKKLQLSKQDRDMWMRGEEVFYQGELEGYVLIFWEKDILGCGKIVDNRLLNYVPKERRIHDPH